MSEMEESVVPGLISLEYVGLGRRTPAPLRATHSQPRHSLCVVLGALVLTLPVQCLAQDLFEPPLVSRAEIEGGSRGLARTGELDALPEHNPSIDDILRSRPGSTRILGGTMAKPGQWPSMAAIFMRKAGERPVSFCGGTVIDDTWVLTAAHCAAAMEKMGKQVSFFIREGGTNITNKARDDIEITSIKPHPNYDAAQTLNDVALLKLARKASVPHQKLLAGDAVAETIVASKSATVIGFGLTNENGAASADLLQADIPIVAQAKCAQVYGANRITVANFCAGREEGGRDSCQGDSGGPIFRPGPNNEQVQIGVVSWGAGCGRPKYPGVYASVGNFEPWLKTLVPGVTFVSRSDKPSDGGQVAPQPSNLAQVSVDIVQGNTVKVGSYIDIRVLSSVTGKLALFNQDPDGRAYQIFPSKVWPSGEGGARIVGGRPLTVPPARMRDHEGSRFEVQPPTGANKLIALVLPDRADVKDLLERYQDGQSIPDLRQHINTLVDREEASRGINPVRITPTDRAVAEREYQIVD